MICLQNLNLIIPAVKLLQKKKKRNKSLFGKLQKLQKLRFPLIQVLVVLKGIGSGCFVFICYVQMVSENEMIHHFRNIRTGALTIYLQFITNFSNKSL